MAHTIVGFRFIPAAEHVKRTTPPLASTRVVRARLSNHTATSLSNWSRSSCFQNDPTLLNNTLIPWAATRACLVARRASIGTLSRSAPFGVTQPEEGWERGRDQNFHSIRFLCGASVYQLMLAAIHHCGGESRLSCAKQQESTEPSVTAFPSTK